MQLLWSLRPIRVHAELSQQALAQSSGLTQARVSDLELGTRVFSASEVEALARALELDPRVLLANAITLTRSGRVRRAR